MRPSVWAKFPARCPYSVTISLSVLILSLVLCVSGCSRRTPAHGAAFLVAFDTNSPASTNDLVRQLERTREVLTARLKNLGVHFSIEPQAHERLLLKVERLGSNDLEAVRQVITQPGLLEFRMVHTNSEELVRAGTVEPGYELLKEERRMPDGKTLVSPILVKNAPEHGLTGKYLERASVFRDSLTDAPQITIAFNPEGARLFERLTTEYQPAENQTYQLAIVLDGELQSAPRIMDVIRGGKAVISGNFTVPEAVALANVLGRPLEVPIRLVEEKTF